jgi:hypothetical protein
MDGWSSASSSLFTVFVAISLRSPRVKVVFDERGLVVWMDCSFPPLAMGGHSLFV